MLGYDTVIKLMITYPDTYQFGWKPLALGRCQDNFDTSRWCVYTHCIHRE